MKLSKTNYLLWRECPKNAWVKVNKPEEFSKFPLSEFEKNIIETGNEVDVLARRLFPNGVLIENRYDSDLTKKLIIEKIKVLYQPVFETEKFITACDILVWNEEQQAYDLYEVKSSTVDEEKEKAKKEKLYTCDLAFQYCVLSESIKINRMYLVRLDKSYSKDGEINFHRLFKIDDFTEKVQVIQSQVKIEIETALEYVSQKKIPEGNCGCIYLGRSAMCTTFDYLNPDYPKYAVNDISRIGQSKAKLNNLVASNTLSILNVSPDFELGEAQRNQVDLAQGKDTIIDENEISTFFDTIQYPISFIDYETFPSALPRFDGYHPYNQIPFQFSLHIVESEDSEPIHFEFLFTKQSKPDFEFIEALEKNIPKTGTLISWNKSFENTINKELRERNISKQKFLQDLNDRTVDLRDVFTKQYFVHKDFKGKTSIKKILPVIAPEFSYGDLEIQEGGQASDVWNKIVSGEYSDLEADLKKQHLLKYCKLDTYAMFLIWKHLSKYKLWSNKIDLVQSR